MVRPKFIKFIDSLVFSFHSKLIEKKKLIAARYLSCTVSTISYKYHFFEFEEIYLIRLLE